MTSSQYDPRPGFDDTIGGDAREDVIASTQGVLDFSNSQTQSYLSPELMFIPDMVDQVFEFNEKVIGLSDVDFNCLTEKQHAWIRNFVIEELNELHEAYLKQDMVGMVDAVGDLIYGAMGTFKKMGLSQEHVRQCFTAIHNANMAKRRGDKGRGSDEDAVKPDGWVAPEVTISEILFLE